VNVIQSAAARANTRANERALSAPKLIRPRRRRWPLQCQFA
jgi:hypothetical protein